MTLDSEDKEEYETNAKYSYFVDVMFILFCYYVEDWINMLRQLLINVLILTKILLLIY
jgi:hypothetical protein